MPDTAPSDAANDAFRRRLGKIIALDPDAPAIEFGRRQGFAGSAQPSSIADGARSTPVTIAPPLANRARSTPAPQPTSRILQFAYPSKSTSRSRWWSFSKWY